MSDVIGTAESTALGAPPVVCMNLSVGDYVIETERCDEDIDYIEVSAPALPKWLKYTLGGISRISKQNMPVDILLRRIGAAVSSHRGKPIRAMRTTDRYGRPCLHFDIEVDGHTLRVLNRLSPIFMEATTENVQWFVSTLYKERAAFLEHTQPSVCADEEHATTEHADSDPLNMDVARDDIGCADADDADDTTEVDATPTFVGYDARFTADNGPEELPESVYYAPSKHSYIVEVKSSGRSEVGGQLTLMHMFLKSKRHREQFRIDRRSFSDYDSYVDARSAGRKKALFFMPRFLRAGCRPQRLPTSQLS
jgi:hypothetical protein